MNKINLVIEDMEVIGEFEEKEYTYRVMFRFNDELYRVYVIDYEEEKEINVDTLIIKENDELPYEEDYEYEDIMSEVEYKKLYRLIEEDLGY